MARAWEYSPAEFINVAFSDIGKLTRAGSALREAQDKNDGSLDALTRIQRAQEAVAEAKSNMFDHIASASVGSIILALGMLFRKRGWVAGGEDEDEEQAAFDKLQGMQEYAIVDNEGNTYTIDWLAPEILPFFTGVAIYDKLFDRAEDEGGLYGAIREVLSGMYEPMLNMSMLSSINNLISEMKYVKEADQIPYLAKSVASSYLSQYAPTIFGKIENITETERKSTYLDRESKLGSDDQYFIASLMNKLPKEYHQITNIDAWGRETSTGNLLRRVVQNMVSPGYYKASAKTPYDDELQRLKDAGFGKVFPEKARQSQKVDEQYLTAGEYELFVRTQGEQNYKLIGDLLNSAAYKRMDDEGKVAAIKKVYSEAKSMAEAAILKERGEGDKIRKTDAEKAGMNTSAYIAANATFVGAKTPAGFQSQKDGDAPTWAAMLAVLDDTTLSTADRLAYVNAKSGRDQDFKTYNEAKEYYQGKQTEAADTIRFSSVKTVYDNAKTPDGYKATEAGNAPGWAKALAVLDNNSISDALKLEYINKKSGRKEPFKTLAEARKYYEKEKAKDKK